MDDGGNPELIKGFSDETLPEQNNEVCIQCHRSKALNEWQGSPHEIAGIGCVDCHKIHDDPLLVTTPVPRSDSFPVARLDVKPVARYVERCFDCHVDVQAQFNYPSRHPVREGYMNCGSCHNPHGTWLGGRKGEESSAQLCMSCHTQYQGPFVFEHEPVAEGCETCHTPHGSVANNLLVQNEPFICLQCHEFHFHAGLEGEEDDEVYIPAYDPDVAIATGRGDPDFGPREPRVYQDTVPNPNREQGYKSAFAKKCTQCHTQVHGTDNPSQTVPGEGKGLMR
jgi:DmsE family decaheme c-type cytochrome